MSSLYLNNIKDKLLSARSGYVIAIIAAVLTGMIHSLPKQLFSFSSIGTELNPLTFIVITYLINAAFFTPHKKDSEPLSKLRKMDMFIILAIALTEVSGLASYFFGLKQSTAINGSILTNGEIIFAVLIAIIIFKESLPKGEIMPFFAIILGIIALPIGYEFFQSNLSTTDLLSGNLLILLSGAFCATDIILCKYVTKRVDPKRITQLVSFSGAIFVLIIMAVFQIPFNVDLRQLPSIAMLGLFGTGFATFLFLIALKIIGITRTVLLYSTQFIFGVIFATVFLHESITIINIISISLASVGIYLLRNKLSTIQELSIPSRNYLKRGSYKTLCETCNVRSCCTSFTSPLLFSHDIDKLKAINKFDDEHVNVIKINGNVLQNIKKKKNSTECIFWDSNSKKCSIYQNRPLDCMIYPFDIFSINGKYYWIVYSCNPKSDWKWSESHLLTFENSNEFMDILLNIESYSHRDTDLLTKIDATKYSIIREVNFNKLLKNDLNTE